MKKIFKTTCIIFILFFSCKKAEEPAYTITGTLRETCGSPPKANAYLEISQIGTTFGQGGQRLYTNTDNEGRFSFTYKSISSSGLTLFYGSSASSTAILMGIPNKETLDLGDVYLNNKVTIIIKLIAGSAHSSSDTLYYGVGNIPANHYITGPFYSHILDTICTRRGYSVGANSYNIKEEQTALGWGFGWEDYYHSILTWKTNPYHIIPFTTRGNCQIDTAYLNIP